jgi:arsenate reductase
MIKDKQRVLFLCTHNAVRSQMAEGLLRSLYGEQYEVYSAGVIPFKVHSLAIETMGEIGIDISQHTSKSIEKFRDMTVDIVVTVCDNARETCPFFPGKKVLHQSFDDPGLVQGSKEQQLQAFRTVRDQITSWIKHTFDESSYA